ncbi:MAG: hypothetical protein AAFP10_02240 [Pseudomonadota bacterium]
MKENKLFFHIILCLFAGFFSGFASADTEYKLTLPEFEQWHHSQEKEQALAYELRDHFLKLQEAIAKRSPDQKKRRGTHAKGHCVTGTFRVLDDDELSPAAVASQSYWSGNAFALGGRPVKLGAYPCNLFVQHSDDLINKTITAGQAKQRGADYLGEQLTDTLQSGGLCHKLFVQLLDETDQYRSGFDKNLIEDTTRVWTGPVHTVAELRINGEHLPAVMCDDPVNGLNPAQVHIDLPGLGQINRARSLVEAASRAAR